jgi:serine/threonine protein kinase
MPRSLDGALLDGRYRLGPLIGEGGMSVVHAGEDLQLGRKVAIKLLVDASDAALAERLFREARAAARTQHPAVVLVFAHGSDAALGVDYVIMEQLKGEDLAARIRREGPLAVPFVEKLLLELSDALAAVHGAGIVHRDLKPANVFLAQRRAGVEEIKLLDFGVAKQVDLHTLTGKGDVLGTLAYMAPEQLRDARAAGPGADIYALGALLYECLAGVPPIRATSSAELLVKVMQGAPPPVLTLRADTPARLASIVDRCLRLRPQQRYASGAELLDALGDRA